MNLQRYVSTVYSEQIDKEDYPLLDKELSLLTPNLNLKFKDILDSYTKKNSVSNPYETIDPDMKYILHNLLFEKVFDHTISKLFEDQKNSIILFPIYNDIDGKNRLRKELENVYPMYRDILNEDNIKKEFERKQGIPLKSQYMFVPAFSDEDESAEEYKERLTQYFNRWYEFMQELKPKPTNLVPKPSLKFDKICYTVDHSGNFFTHYYKTKLNNEKSKILNQTLSSFLERLGLNNRSEVKDPILQVTSENVTRKYKADGKKLSESKINALLDLLKKFIDIYKRTNDKEYLKTATSRDQQSIFRIYYRVNRTDETDDFTTIKTGSTYVYKMKPNEGDTKIGYFNEKEGIQTTYTFREYSGLTQKFKEYGAEFIEKAVKKTKEKKKDSDGKEKNSDEKDIDHLFKAGQPMMINITSVGSVLYYKQLKKGKPTNKYDGTIEYFKDLHNYEHYKWLNFRDMNGAFTSDTNIKFYENILFDKESLIGFLTKRNEWTPQTKVNQMFLKINQDNSLLLEYASYVMNEFSDTNVYISGNIKNFVEDNKKSIVNILFETNQLLYLTSSHSSEEKTNISKNYKMVQYKYYEARDVKEATRHFQKTIEVDEESSYCGRSHTCDLLKVIQTNLKDAIEYAVVIVDVTKDNIDVDSTLKSKTNCKKLLKSLRRQIQPYLVAFAPRWGGTRKRSNNKRKSRRRRKYIH